MTSAHDEWWPFNTGPCFLYLKKNFVKVISSPDIPFCCNLESKPLCQTLSNALDISRKTPLISLLLSKAEGISCAVDSNWLVQKSPGLNSGCFGDIKSVSEKMKTCCYKITVQILYHKPVEEKLGDKFLSSLSPFLNVGTTFAFFHLDKTLPECNQFWKIISSGLHMEMPQSFIMWILIMLWPWALLGSRFFILYISSFDNSETLLVCLKHVLGKGQIFFNKNWKVDICL